MKTLICILVILSGNLWVISIANAAGGGDSGGSGGDPFTDEANELRRQTLEIFRYEKDKFPELLEYAGGNYNGAIERMQKIYIRRKDQLGYLVAPGLTAPISLKDTLETRTRQSIGDLFFINGEPKTSINITLDVPNYGTIDLFIMDPNQWDRLSTGSHNHEVNLLRKIRHTAHELLGILKLETTGQAHISSRITLESIRKVSFRAKDQPTSIPVVPLWSDAFSATIPIEHDHSCFTPSVQNRLKTLISDACRKHTPNETPAPFWAYECAFEGSFKTPTEVSYTTIVTTKKNQIPEHHSITIHGKTENYFYKSSKTIINAFKHRWHYKKMAIPQHTQTTKEVIRIPRHQTYCSIVGTLFLTGIDPIIEGKQNLQLIASSKDTWDEELSHLEANPEHLFRNICFHKRKQIRRGLVNSSICAVYELPNGDGRWRWELWAPHAHLSEYQFELMESDHE